MSELKCSEGDLALIVDSDRPGAFYMGRLVYVGHRGKDDPTWGPTWVVGSILNDDERDIYPNSVEGITLHPEESFEQPDALLMPFGTLGLENWALRHAMNAIEETQKAQDLFINLALEEQGASKPLYEDDAEARA